MRWAEMHGEREVSDLAYGMDFRMPIYRREVFLRFWEFHLKHRSHPGCVYYLMPALAATHGWSVEQRLWFAYINGNTQNPVTSYRILKAFPSLEDLDEFALERWFNEHYKQLYFDTDRRHQKPRFLQCVSNYRSLVAPQTQEEFFKLFDHGGPEQMFRNLWRFCMDNYDHFGRLSVFSYLEYLRVMGLPVECDQLFLDDMEGSKSHRNGLCKVLGRDDLDWHHSNPSFSGRYDESTLRWLDDEAHQLLREAKARMPNQPDVGFFTLESALCTYKSWHRPNRRYPNVYNDMLVGRIRESEGAWHDELEIFWAIRRQALPRDLRLEDNPADCGVKPRKQNHYRLTGQTVMMDTEWECFRNDFNDDVRRRQA